MGKPSRVIDYDTATLEDMRKLGEAIALADMGVPWRHVFGESEPPANEPSFTHPMMDPIAYMHAIMCQGED